MRCQVCKRERCMNEMSVNVSIVWNCDRLLNEMPANNYIDSLEACLKLVSLISSWFDAFRSSVEIKRCHGNSVVGPEPVLDNSLWSVWTPGCVIRLFLCSALYVANVWSPCWWDRLNEDFMAVVLAALGNRTFCFNGDGGKINNNKSKRKEN